MIEYAVVISVVAGLIGMGYLLFENNEKNKAVRDNSLRLKRILEWNEEYGTFGDVKIVKVTSTPRK